MLLRRFLLPPVALTLLGFATSGCAPSVQRNAVQAGDWDAIRTSIADARASGKLSADDAHRLAKLVIERELRLVPADKARKLVEQLRPCATAAAAALEMRAKEADEAGAFAEIALYEAGRKSSSSLVKHAEDADPAWRAVGARGLLRSSDGELRRRAMVDPDERVRKQALKAAMHAADPADAKTLLEAARLDPSPSARESALRALGALGGEPLVLSLRDLYAMADEADRRAIVEAWGMPKSAEAGGIRQLARVLETEAGSPAILAAATLVRLGGEGASAGLTVLVRAMGEGASRHRALAIRLAPLEKESVLVALRVSAAESDPVVRVAALTKLTTSPPDRALALDTLAELAESGLHPAAIALARAGDPRGATYLKERLDSADPDSRSSAAKALIEGGNWQSAASLLGDGDASVRTEVACQLLTLDSPTADPLQ